MTIEKKYNPRCFFDVEVGEKSIGRIVFELFADVCPITCENFRAICTGECGLGKTTGKPLHYKGVKFHRVIKNFMIQGGDFSVGNGSGGESIYGGTFKDECFDVRHDQPFLLSMANRGKDTNGSQFFITTQRTPHLDGVHVVFGRVIKGEDVVQTIEKQPTDANSSPLQPVIISNCGELVLKKKQKEKKKRKASASPSKSEAESGAEGTEKGEKKKHKKHHKHRSKKPKKEKSKSDEGHEKENPDSDADEFSINPKEIPEVPANNFLMRRVDPVDDNYRGGPNRGGGFNRRPMMSRSGRKIKGRGFMRYRTPSPEGGRSGSETPPHWKQAQSRIRPFKEVEESAKEAENLDPNEEGAAPEGTDIGPTTEKPKGHEEEEEKEDRRNRDRNRARDRDRNRDRGQEYNRDRGSETDRKRERNRDRPQDSDRSQDKQRSRDQNHDRDAQHEEEPRRERPSRNGNTSDPVRRDRRDRRDEPFESRNRQDRRDRDRSPSRDEKSRRDSRRRHDESSSNVTGEGDRHRTRQDSRHGFRGTQEDKSSNHTLSSGAPKESGALGMDVHKNETVDSSRSDSRREVMSSHDKEHAVLQGENSTIMAVVPPGARHLSSLPVMVDPTEPPPPGVEPDEFSLNLVESLTSSQSKWDSKVPSGSSHRDSAASSETKKPPSPTRPRRNRWSTGPPSSNPAPDEEPKRRTSESERPPEPTSSSAIRAPNKPQIERRTGNAPSANRRQSPERQQRKTNQSPERRQTQSSRRGRSSSSASPRRRPSRSRSRGRRGRTRSSSEGRRRRQRNRSRSRSRKKSRRSTSSSSHSDRGRTRNRRRNRDSSDDGSRGRSRRARRRPSSSSSDSSSSSSSAGSGSSGKKRRRKGRRHSRRRRRSSTSSSGSSSS